MRHPQYSHLTGPAFVQSILNNPRRWLVQLGHGIGNAFARGHLHSFFGYTVGKAQQGRGVGRLVCHFNRVHDRHDCQLGVKRGLLTEQRQVLAREEVAVSIVGESAGRANKKGQSQGKNGSHGLTLSVLTPAYKGETPNGQ